MRSLALIGSMVLLPACATVRPVNDNPTTERFVPLTDDQITPDIERLIDIIKETGKQFGVTPYPEFRIVKPTHKMLGGYRLGRAVVFESGKEALYLSKAELERPRSLYQTIEHEMAHFAAWRQFGHDIPEHGSEWRATCLVNARHSRESCKARE
jgi:hypothetical protein